MYISGDTIIKAATILTSALTILGIVWGIVLWVLKQNKNPKKIEDLQTQHNKDIKELKDELCVLSYAMLAALDGLMQLKCNGNVTKAHDRLEKHLNQQAHDQV
ncbi:MAG: branched-chain amino acid ABC transporter permease [Clostridia bacterium]|nr:branched-chain amino acid ABC transporter permease [Clostridia bacterium]